MDAFFYCMNLRLRMRVIGMCIESMHFTKMIFAQNFLNYPSMPTFSNAKGIS